MRTIKWLALALLLIAQVQGKASIQNEKPGLFIKENTTTTRGDVPPDPPEPGGGTLPLGSGLLVLTGLAAGYALVKGKRKEK